MKDLKQCILDLLRSGGISVGENTSSQNNIKTSQKPKKLHEYKAADCNAAFLRKYHNIAFERQMNTAPQIIYFNENLSMARKYDTENFSMARHPRRPLINDHDCSISSESFSPLSSKSGTFNDINAYTDDDEDYSENDKYTYSPDNDRDTLIDASSGQVDLRRNNDDCTEEQLDSFCTLCTSSFSYNNCCRYCESSFCGSKCNSERGSRASRGSKGYQQIIQPGLLHNEQRQGTLTTSHL